jgi:hypothetical protein
MLKHLTSLCSFYEATEHALTSSHKRGKLKTGSCSFTGIHTFTFLCRAKLNIWK